MLKPDGLLLSPSTAVRGWGVARWQRRLNPAWTLVSGGCNMDRPIATLLRDGGFAPDSMETLYLPGPKVLSYHYWGAAARA